MPLNNDQVFHVAQLLVIGLAGDRTDSAAAMPTVAKYASIPTPGILDLRRLDDHCS